MLKSFREVNDDLLDRICMSYEIDYDFNLLKDRFPDINHNMLFSILYSTGKYNEKLYRALPQVHLPDNKILIISDTHYGSIFEEFHNTDTVFDFAAANGIHTILHGGDIIEGNLKRRKGFSSIKQAYYFIKTYPYDEGITTHTLYGNHDFLAISRNEEVGKVLSSREDIKNLGFKKVYINFNGTIISLQHDIDNYKLCFPPKGEYVSFGGHSHFYHIREKQRWKNEKIYIPSMCNDKIYLTSSTPQESYKNASFKPGFLIAEVDDTTINVTNYSFSQTGVVRENELQKVLTKKIK